jgi:hypothetical protein
MGKSKKDIETQLRDAILESGITPFRLAEMSGVNRTILCHFLKGRRSMVLTTAAHLADTLGFELVKTRKPKG